MVPRAFFQDVPSPDFPALTKTTFGHLLIIRFKTEMFPAISSADIERVHGPMGNEMAGNIQFESEIDTEIEVPDPRRYENVRIPVESFTVPVMVGSTAVTRDSKSGVRMYKTGLVRSTTTGRKDSFPMFPAVSMARIYNRHSPSDMATDGGML